MLLEIAIGDAYGAGFEFRERSLLERCNTLQQYLDHPHGVAAGRYTDDTQMSLAVCEVLLSDAEPTTARFADAFVTAFRRDPRRGYAQGLYTLLESCRDGAGLVAGLRRGSRRNGAAMRSVPLGLLPTLDRVEAACRAQTAATHDTAEALLGSRVVALMAHDLLYERVALRDLAPRIERRTGLRLRADWSAEVECDAIDTVHAVHSLLASRRSQAGLLQAAVALGGDVDSVAAITLGLACLSGEIAADLPHGLLSALEDGRYGQGWLREVDRRLAQRFPALRPGTLMQFG